MTRDAHPQLVRLLCARAGAGARLVSSAASGWASLTYVGQRHRLTFALSPHVADDLAEGARRPEGSATIVELAATTVEHG